jgi:hypothetical protein
MKPPGQTPISGANPARRLIICWLCSRIGLRDVETLSAPADAREARIFRGAWQLGIEGWICPKCVLRREGASQN